MPAQSFKGARVVIGTGVVTQKYHYYEWLQSVLDAYSLTVMQRRRLPQLLYSLYFVTKLFKTVLYVQKKKNENKKKKYNTFTRKKFYQV